MLSRRNPIPADLTALKLWARLQNLADMHNPPLFAWMTRNQVVLKQVVSEALAEARARKAPVAPPPAWTGTERYSADAPILYPTLHVDQTSFPPVKLYEQPQYTGKGTGAFTSLDQVARRRLARPLDILAFLIWPLVWDRVVKDSEQAWRI